LRYGVLCNGDEGFSCICKKINAVPQLLLSSAEASTASRALAMVLGSPRGKQQLQYLSRQCEHMALTTDELLLQQTIPVTAVSNYFW
jgi:hypothetical protein